MSYLLEWGKLNFQDRFLNFLSFIDDVIPHCIDQICQHADSRYISLHGWSMAGSLSSRCIPHYINLNMLKI